jgi:hypothetical protein
MFDWLKNHYLLPYEQKSCFFPVHSETECVTYYTVRKNSMNTMSKNYSKNKLFYRLAAAVALLLVLSETSGATSQWWEKGINLFGDFGEGKKADTFSVDEISAALKEALRVGTTSVTNQLGRFDGFNGDPAIHIPLPEKIQTVKSVLDRVGMSQLVDDLELKLNRAAEKATRPAKELFFQAIGDMTLDDVKGIYDGPDDAATRYFQKKMTPALAKEMRPVVDESLSTVGAIQTYDTLMGQYRSIPFVPDVKADLTEYVIEKGMDGIFYYLAKEEAAIRQNPAKRTTELLKRVFGSR